MSRSASPEWEAWLDHDQGYEYSPHGEAFGGTGDTLTGVTHDEHLSTTNAGPVSAGQPAPPPRTTHQRLLAISRDRLWDGNGPMPCPFRLAMPAYFDRSKNKKFSPCYTTHRQIFEIV